MTDWAATAASRQEDWLDLLATLVDTDSGPGDAAGIGDVYSILEERLGRLGFESRRVPTAGPDVLTSRRPGSDGSPRLAIIGHADTVFATGTVAERPFSRRGDRVMGPGVADMKGGLVVAIGGLELAGPAVLDRFDITVIVNGDEESGSAQSRELIEEMAPGFDAALVFEPGRPPNRIVASRRGAHRFEVEVTGRPAHTGVNPEDGANAIETAAHHVLTIQELGRSIPEATVNAVIIGGGTRPNIVPEHARIRVDSRFDSDEAERAVVAGMERLNGDGPVPGTHTVVRHLDRRPAFPVQEAASRLARAYVEEAAAQGVEIEAEPTGGSSDGNFTAAAGVPTLDGLGAVGHEYHTADEFVITASIAQRAAVFAGLLSRLAEEGL